jgi:hypothetical protein
MDLLSERQVNGAHSFIALCRLTEILGDILALIYTLKPLKDHNCFKSLRRFEALLDEWEDSLDPGLRPGSPGFLRAAPGALNIQLSFLAIKMCIARIALQVIYSPCFVSLIYWMHFADAITRRLYVKATMMIRRPGDTIFLNVERQLSQP